MDILIKIYYNAYVLYAININRKNIKKEVKL